MGDMGLVDGGSLAGNVHGAGVAGGGNIEFLS